MCNPLILTNKDGREAGSVWLHHPGVSLGLIQEVETLAPTPPRTTQSPHNAPTLRVSYHISGSGLRAWRHDHSSLLSQIDSNPRPTQLVAGAQRNLDLNSVHAPQSAPLTPELLTSNTGATAPHCSSNTFLLIPVCCGTGHTGCGVTPC